MSEARGSGWRWDVRAHPVPRLAPTIMVIESDYEGADEYADRRERERGARRVPFGFARALLEPEEGTDS